jgi:hypothetical protein
MENARMKNVVWIVTAPDYFVSRYGCDVEGLHWPHIVRTKMKHLIGEPVVTTVCPGSGGQGLLIAERVGDGEKEWMVQDADTERRMGEVIKLIDEDIMMVTYPLVNVEVEKYEGTRMSCGKKEPHYPHITGTYNTVRYGVLHYYCPGWSGDGLDIYEDRWFGDAQTPDRSWFFVMRS